MIDHTTDPLTYARWELGVYQKQIESFARKMAAALAEGDTRKADYIARMIEGTVLNMKDAREEITAAELEAHRATFARNIDRAAAIGRLTETADARKRIALYLSNMTTCREALTIARGSRYGDDLQFQIRTDRNSVTATERTHGRSIESARQLRQPTAETDYTGAPIAAD